MGSKTKMKHVLIAEARFALLVAPVHASTVAFMATVTLAIAIARVAGLAQNAPLLLTPARVSIVSMGGPAIRERVTVSTSTPALSAKLHPQQPAVMELRTKMKLLLTAEGRNALPVLRISGWLGCGLTAQNPVMEGNKHAVSRAK